MRTIGSFLSGKFHKGPENANIDPQDLLNSQAPDKVNEQSGVQMSPSDRNKARKLQTQYVSQNPDELSPIGYYPPADLEAIVKLDEEKLYVEKSQLSPEAYERNIAAKQYWRILHDMQNERIFTGPYSSYSEDYLNKFQLELEAAERRFDQAWKKTGGVLNEGKVLLATNNPTDAIKVRLKALNHPEDKGRLIASLLYGIVKTSRPEVQAKQAGQAIRESLDAEGMTAQHAAELKQAIARTYFLLQSRYDAAPVFERIKDEIVTNGQVDQAKVAKLPAARAFLQRVGFEC